MTISKCRRDLLHKEPNGIISTKLEVSDKNFAETKCLANEIPICSLQLCGLRVEKAVEGLEEERGCALGYIDQYKTETWDAWMNSFQLQTCTRYSIRKGKHIPMKTEKHGLVQYSEKIVGYTVKHSQTYHCFRVGNGRLKPEKMIHFYGEVLQVASVWVALQKYIHDCSYSKMELKCLK